MTTPRCVHSNRFVTFLIILCYSTLSIHTHKSELFESAEFPNSQYDIDTDLHVNTQLQFAPPLPTTKSPRPLLGPDDNTLMSSSSLSPSTSYTELKGGSITNERILHSNESPFAVREPIVIEKNGKLIIEPGVRLEFAPNIGITVRGILHAVVSFIFLFFFFNSLFKSHKECILSQRNQNKTSVIDTHSLYISVYFSLSFLFFFFFFQFIV